MSEKKVYVFASRWGDGGFSYWKHCLNNKVVFINNECDSETDFPKIARGVKKGDIIALRDGETMYAVGIANNDAVVKNVLTGKPLFTNKEELIQYGIDSDVDAVYITVYEWYKCTDQDKSVFNLSGLRDRIYLSLNGKYNSTREKIIEIYSREKLEQKMDENELMQSVENLLKSNHNLVLTGAPGTGKTHLAKQIAATMIFGEDISLEDINNDESKKEKFDYQCKFVQFHPSYDYTDFVEGIRPVTKEDNNSGFERKDGVFKEFCKRAIYININYHRLVVDKLKEFCEFLLNETQSKTIEIENVRGIKGAPAPIKTVIYNKESETVKVLVNTESGSNGISPTTLHQIAEWYKLYITQFLELDEKQQNMKTFDNILGITYGGNHTYIYGFIKLFHDKYKDHLEIPSYYHINKNNDTPFIFIIDEINRGDFNKIFGELFYAIDPGYRGEKGKADTQYQNLVKYDDIFINGFYIPENVYIIGTMNDIDRSVESMDFAIRRRFAWQEIAPKDTAAAILKTVKIQKAELILEKFNELIASPECLGKMYQLGASYFLKLNNYIDDDKVNDTESINEAYKKLWNNHLHGLIYEYVRGKKSGDVIYKQIHDKYLELTGVNPIAPDQEKQQEQEY
ncbi:MAG: AAA family ATPase [Mucispirillum sp.]|nr:AAA family ATPase [Mucispirillum sp.]